MKKEIQKKKKKIRIVKSREGKIRYKKSFFFFRNKEV